MLLEAAFRPLRAPWRFFDIRDTRTLFHAADVRFYGRLSGRSEATDWRPARIGDRALAHDALADALWQADCVQAAVMLLG